MIKFISCLLLFISLPIISAANINSFDEISTFIKAQEGFLESPKWDVSQYSVGYSTSVEYARKHGYAGGKMSVARADYILQHKMLDISVELKAMFPEIGSYPKSVQIALHSAFYNNPTLVGKRIKALLKKRDYAAVARDLAWGNLPKKDQLGLINRRFREANLIREELGVPLFATPKTVAEFYKKKSVNQRA